MIFRDSRDLKYIKGFPYPAEEHKALVIKVEKGKFVCYKPSLMRRLKRFVQDKILQWEK
jgi:hypothetical protein